MVKITCIMIIRDSKNFNRNSIESIINQSYKDFELILIKRQSDNILSEYSGKDDRINTINTENILQSCNRIINNANGEYIQFIDQNNILEDNVLEKLVKRLENLPDILLYKTNNKKNKKQYKLLALNQNETFNHRLISDLIFDLEITPYNKIYRKEFLNSNNTQLNTQSLYDFETFHYKTILEAEKIEYTDITAYKTSYPRIEEQSPESFKEYMDTQEANLQLFKQGKYYRQAVNKIIENTIKQYDNISIKYKKKAYTLLREHYLDILCSEDINSFITSLTYENHKRFEQVIISESAEEYQLLKNVYQDKKTVNYNKRYKKILETQHGDIKRFNDSLKSSNSWKLTRIFRI